MNKAEIVAFISENSGVTAKVVESVLKYLPDALIKSLDETDKATIPGVCIMKSKYYPSKKITNYLINKEAIVPEKMRITMKPSSKLADGITIKRPK